MKHEVAKYHVTKQRVEDASAEECGKFLLDSDAVFPDTYLMHVTADKAGLVVLDYFEAYHTEPPHRYALAQYESDQCEGGLERISNCFSRTDKVLNLTGPTFLDWEAELATLNQRGQNADEWANWCRNIDTARSDVTQEAEARCKASKDISTRDVSKGRLHASARAPLNLRLETEPGMFVDTGVIESSIGVCERLEMAFMSTLGPTDSIDPKEPVCAIAQAVSGSHYNEVVPGMQYMECMQYMLEGRVGVEAHLFGQVYKYLMRAGKKDPIEQDVRKAKWYLNCLTKYLQTGKIDVYNND